MFGFRGVFGRKPRLFDYKPRYYDVEKEAREERKREILGSDYKSKYDTQAKPYKPGQYIREGIYTRRGIQRDGKSNTVAVRRLVVILLLLGVMTWWLLTDFQGGAEEVIRSMKR